MNPLPIVQSHNTDDKLAGSEPIKVLSTTVSLLWQTSGSDRCTYISIIGKIDRVSRPIFC